MKPSSARNIPGVIPVKVEVRSDVFDDDGHPTGEEAIIGEGTAMINVSDMIVDLDTGRAYVKAIS